MAIIIDTEDNLTQNISLTTRKSFTSDSITIQDIATSENLISFKSQLEVAAENNLAPCMSESLLKTYLGSSFSFVSDSSAVFRIDSVWSIEAMKISYGKALNIPFAYWVVQLEEKVRKGSGFHIYYQNFASVYSALLKCNDKKGSPISKSIAFDKQNVLLVRLRGTYFVYIKEISQYIERHHRTFNSFEIKSNYQNKVISHGSFDIETNITNDSYGYDLSTEELFLQIDLSNTNTDIGKLKNIVKLLDQNGNVVNQVLNATGNVIGNFTTTQLTLEPSSDEIILHNAPTITIDNSQSTTYEMLQYSDKTYKVYVGEDVISDDLVNAFYINKIVGNQAYTTTTRYQNALSKSYVTLAETPKQSNTTLDFSYVVDGVTIVKTIPSENLIKLDLEDTSLFSVPDSYLVGDTFLVESIDTTNFGFSYTDGKLIKLSEMGVLNSNIITANRSEGVIETTEVGKQYTYYFNIQTTYFGNIKFQKIATIYRGSEESKVARIEYIIPTQTLKVGDTISIPSGSSITCYNVYDKIIKTFIGASKIKESGIKLDSKYGTQIAFDMCDDNEHTLTSKLTLDDNEFTIEAKYCTKYDNNLQINSVNVNKSVYFVNYVDNFEFDYTNLVIKYDKHNNDFTDGVFSSNVETITITDNLSNYCSHEEIDWNLDENTYDISVSVTNYNTLSKSNAFSIKFIKEKINSFSFDTSSLKLTYYNTGKDKFVYPTSVSRGYNSGRNDTVAFNDIKANMWFSQYENFNSASVNGADLVLNPNISGNKIYVKYIVSDDNILTTSLDINFVNNNVKSIRLTSTPSFILGNVFAKVNFSNIVVEATYDDGTIDSDYKDYELTRTNETSTELLSGVDFTIIDKTNQANNSISVSSSSVTWVNPTIKELVVDSSAFRSNYLNGSDTANANGISCKLTFTNATYVQTINVFESDKNATLENNEYNVYAQSGSQLGSYVFNGESVINITLPENQDSIYINTFIKYKPFYQTETIEQSLKQIMVLNLTEITSISFTKQPKTSYSVGDKFLEHTDELVVRVSYKSGDGTTRRMNIDLSSDFNAINIYPIRNTKFTRTSDLTKVQITASNNTNISLSYDISVSYNVDYSSEKTHTCRVIYEPLDKFSYNGEYRHYLVVESQDRDTIITDDKVLGYVDGFNDSLVNGKLVLKKDYIPPIKAESNIRIKFPTYVRDNANCINYCKFGQLFGQNNAKNRLFVSGNSDFKNRDWHSNTDFTYFEDMQYADYGQTDNEVVGYDIVSNDKMVVLKSYSDKEPTIYYRTSTLVTAIDGGGNVQKGFDNSTLYEEGYSISIGNIGASAVSNKAIVNFNGDTLFLSNDKQLDGLNVSGIIGDNQRYSYSRSRFIDPKLSDLDMTKCWLWTNNKYLYLITPNEVYITHYETISSELSQYEWWRADIKDVQVMIEIDGETYYGTSDGKFYKLDNNDFVDVYKDFIGRGGIKFKAEDETDKILVSKEHLEFLSDEASEYYLKVYGDIYYKVANISNVNNDSEGISIDTNLKMLEVKGLSMQMLISENRLYYFKSIKNGTTIIQSNKPYKFKLYKGDDLLNKGTLYKICDEYGKELTLDSSFSFTGAVLCRKIEEPLKIINFDIETQTFELLCEHGQKVDLYENNEPYFEADIIKYSLYNSYYITAPLLADNLMYNKVIWSWTITNDTNIPSTVVICEATNDKQLIEMTDNIRTKDVSTYEFDLNDIDFRSVDFSTSQVPYKQTYFKPLLIPFICFGFVNKIRGNSVLSKIQVMYSYSGKAYGRNN